MCATGHRAACLPSPTSRSCSSPGATAIKRPSIGWRRRPPAPAPAGRALHGGRTARTRAPDHGAGERGLPPAGRLEGRSVAEPGALFRPGRASHAADSGRCRAVATAGEARRRPHVSLSDVADLGIASADLVALDDALTTLETLNPRHSRVVELRFFGGLSLKEVSHVLNVSVGTLRRDWSLAQAWLYRELSRGGA